jgi:hypothetical protein
MVEVVLSYCHCCLVDRTLLQLLPYLHSKGVGVINASVLCMGLLTKQASRHAMLLCSLVVFVWSMRKRMPQFPVLADESSGRSEHAECFIRARSPVLNCFKHAAFCKHLMVIRSVVTSHTLSNADSIEAYKHAYSLHEHQPTNARICALQGPPAWHPAPTAVKDAARRAAEVADKDGVDIAKLAIVDAVRQPGIATSLIGFATPQQVRIGRADRSETLLRRSAS